MVANNESNVPYLSANKPILYSYWRSSAAWRVRIVLALKGIDYEYQAVNLVRGEQKSEQYRKTVHPGGLVPAFKVQSSPSSVPESSIVITQSLAIIDYLDKALLPNRAPLLPDDPIARAKVLELTFTIACDTHPLQNLRILQGYPEGEERKKRAQQVINDGLRTFETLLPSPSSPYYKEDRCVGSTITLADVVLVPQFYNALRWECDVSSFPRCRAIYEGLGKHSAFIAAHPDNQPDSPSTEGK